LEYFRWVIGSDVYQNLPKNMATEILSDQIDPIEFLTDQTSITITKPTYKFDMPIGDRMKMYEDQHNQKISPEDYFCVRLDGHTFSKFTSGFEKPFDVNFSRAMVMSAYDAICEFHAKSAYTQSDEITLIFDRANLEKGQTHIYDGRKQKLVSLCASFVSIRFNYHLNKLVKMSSKPNLGDASQKDFKKSYSEITLRKISNSTAFFDARILTFTSELKEEILNHLIWRSSKDCYRNAISMYAMAFYPHKALDKKNSDEKIKLLEEKGIKWSEVPMWQKYGVFIKKDLMKLTNNVGEEYFRTKPIGVSFKLQFSNQNLEFFLSDHYLEPTTEQVGQMEIYPYSFETEAVI